MKISPMYNKLMVEMVGSIFTKVRIAGQETIIPSEHAYILTVAMLLSQDRELYMAFSDALAERDEISHLQWLEFSKIVHSHNMSGVSDASLNIDDILRKFR